MKEKNKIKAINEKGAYQILSLPFLRNLWIAIPVCLRLNRKYSRRKPSKEVKLLQEHHLGWQWWCTTWQGSPKHCDLVSIPGVVGGRVCTATSCHSQRGTEEPKNNSQPLEPPEGYRGAQGQQPALGTPKCSISTEKHHLDSWRNLSQKFPKTRVLGKLKLFPSLLLGRMTLI